MYKTNTIFFSLFSKSWLIATLRSVIAHDAVINWNSRKKVCWVGNKTTHSIHKKNQLKID